LDGRISHALRTNGTQQDSALNRRQVRYVIIGAFAAIAQQAPIPATRDIDITPDAAPAPASTFTLPDGS